MDNDPGVFNWHERFQVQAGWTRPLRDYLYRQASINNKSKILEAGCGTGVITSDLADRFSISPIGIDIDFPRLGEAASHDKRSRYACADVYDLPFQDAQFDLIISHYFFLWLKDPVKACLELARILKPGGMMFALTEPDYLSRVEYPPIFEELGERQTKALISQGAAPSIGRVLPEIFFRSGIKDLQFGLSGFQRAVPPPFDPKGSEWSMLRKDLTSASREYLDEMERLDQQYCQEGSRVSWVPTFYIYGRKY